MYSMLLIVGAVIWYLMLIVFLYYITNWLVLLVILFLLIPFNYIMLMFMELFVILFLLYIIIIGSSTERSRSVMYLVFFGYVLGMFLLLNNTLKMIGLVMIIIRMSKLPMYSLHVWLPKVHVEASLMGSIVLAGRVLKVRILFLWNFGLLIIGLMILMSFSGFIMMVGSDGKWVMAYSSVLHITICVFSILIVMLYVRFTHIVVSPLLFAFVYYRYTFTRSRVIVGVGWSRLFLYLLNFGFPYLGSFHAELYIMNYLRIFFIVIFVMYVVVRYVFIKLLMVNDDVSLWSVMYSFVVLPVLYLIVL